MAASNSENGWKVEDDGFVFRPAKRRRMAPITSAEAPSAAAAAAAASGDAGSATTTATTTTDDASREKRRRISQQFLNQAVDLPPETDEDKANERNKLMRKSQERSRKSLTNRGKRLSTMGGGDQIVLPHPAVQPSEYYKHISADLPDPVRMRTLLVLCGRKARIEPPSADTDEDSASKKTKWAVASVQQALLRALNSGGIDLSWYQNAAFAASTTKTIKEHPVNKVNKGQEQRLLSEIARLKAENDSWNRVFEATRDKHIEAMGNLTAADEPHIDNSTLSLDEQRLLSRHQPGEMPLDLDRVHMQATYMHHAMHAANRLVASCEQQVRRVSESVTAQVHTRLHLKDVEMDGKQLLRSMTQLAPSS
ncbi:hypothetical protein RI367_000166 [Sorochytrium milnesiophthora]